MHSSGSHCVAILPWRGSGKKMLATHGIYETELTAEYIEGLRLLVDNS